MSEREGVEPDDVLRAVLALPGVELREHASSVGVRVRGKGFAYLAEEQRFLMVKATRDEQDALVAADPDVYSRSHTSGRFGWVGVRLPGARADEVVELLTEAWRLTAPKRLADGYGVPS
jgi:hypothetical protein